MAQAHFSITSDPIAVLPMPSAPAIPSSSTVLGPKWRGGAILIYPIAGKDRRVHQAVCKRASKMISKK